MDENNPINALQMYSLQQQPFPVLLLRTWIAQGAVLDVDTGRLTYRFEDMRIEAHLGQSKFDDTLFYVLECSLRSS